jgi:hypothetical protein
MSALKFQSLSPTPTAHPTLCRRILRMSTVWAALGAIMGASIGLERGGIIWIIATMIAGMVELAVLGVIFALIGGRPEESIVGAVGGLLAGLTVGMAGGSAPVGFVASFGLVFGAITGATLRPYLRLLALPVSLLGRMLNRHRRPAVVALRHDGFVAHQPALARFHRHGPVNHSVGVQSPLHQRAITGSSIR